MDYAHELHRLLPGSGIQASSGQVELLATFAEWLEGEALRAGGIGPAEAERIVDRHVLDALTFALVFEQFHHRPASVIDLGSGVGLPGIPLAIVHPDVPFRLIDRSGRRTALAARAVRILELANVDVVQRDFSHPGVSPASTVVARAALPPETLLPVVERTVSKGGLGVVAASRWHEVETPPFRPHRVHLDVLDLTRWFLIMAPDQAKGGAAG